MDVTDLAPRVPAMAASSVRKLRHAMWIANSQSERLTNNAGTPMAQVYPNDPGGICPSLAGVSLSLWFAGWVELLCRTWQKHEPFLYA